MHDPGTASHSSIPEYRLQTEMNGKVQVCVCIGRKKTTRPSKGGSDTNGNEEGTPVMA